MRKWFGKSVAFLMATMLFLSACGGTVGTDSSESTRGIGSASKDAIFKIGTIPDFDQTELTRAFDDFGKYLSKETGMKVEYVPTVDYASLVTAFERGEIQLAWFGGLTGVQARAAIPGAEAIAQRPADETFQTVFIQKKGLGLTDLQGLRGHTLTFGSESSTSGHLMPRYFMMEAGINPDTDLNAKPNYSGSHDKTYKLVEAGSFETGAVNMQYWDKAVAEGKVDLNKVEEFYRTPEYYDYNWTINDVDATYGEGTKEKVKAVLLNMKTEDSVIMPLLSTDRFIETQNANYIKIEEVAKQLGIIQ